MHEVLVNCLGDLSLSRKSVVRSTDRPDMTLDVCLGRKTTMQQQQQQQLLKQAIVCKYSPGLATQLWSDGCVAWGVYIFQDIAKVWS